MRLRRVIVHVRPFKRATRPVGRRMVVAGVLVKPSTEISELSLNMQKLLPAGSSVTLPELSQGPNLFSH